VFSAESPARPLAATAGRRAAGAALLAAFLAVLAVTELGWSLLAVPAPAAAAGYGVAALLAPLCLTLRPAADARVAALLPPLAAISVVRLVTVVALPAQVHPSTRLLVVGVPALVAVALAARQRPPHWRLLRPHTGGWWGQALVALVGALAGRLVWGLAPPTVPVGAGVSTALAATVVMLAALPDELLYRGLLIPAAADVVGRWSVPLAAAAYAMAYLPGGSDRQLLAALLLGLGLGWCRRRTGSVVGAVAAHGLLNLVVYVLLPLAASS
jgi:membrane protease YdiL (CAAX protease family)